MDRRIYIALASIALVFLSCAHSVEPDNTGSVVLSASVQSTSVNFKSAAEAVPFENITSETPLEAKLLFSYERGNYSTSNPDEGYAQGTDNPNCIPCHTNVSYINDAYTFITYTRTSKEPQNLKYPSPTEGNSSPAPVYCVGLYPYKISGTEGWTINNGTSATHNVDGKTDLMFASEIQGQWNSPFPVQQYEHLQTWLKVLVSASTTDAAQKWGKLQKITVESMKEVKVLFNCTSSDYPTGEKQDIVVFEDDIGKDLDVTSIQRGSVFVVPPLLRASDTDKTLIVKVKVYTEVFETGKEVDVKLFDIYNKPVIDYSALKGKLFVMNLNFTPLSVIQGICTLNSWNALDEDLELEQVKAVE